MPQQPWTKEKIKALLLTNDKAVERALLRLYERQTDDEKNLKATHHSNGRGFNGRDARYYSTLAEKVRAGQTLRYWELSNLRKGNGITKYAGQLLECIPVEKRVN